MGEHELAEAVEREWAKFPSDKKVRLMQDAPDVYWAVARLASYVLVSRDMKRARR